MARIYTGAEVAERVGLSWQRFRRVRHDWVKERDFPAELNEEGEAVRYLADPVDRWLERRSRRLTGKCAEPETSPAPHIPSPTQAGRFGRAQLQLIRGG